MDSAPTCQDLAWYGYAQELGFSIAAVAEISEARDNGSGSDKMQRKGFDPGSRGQDVNKSTGLIYGTTDSQRRLETDEKRPDTMIVGLWEIAAKRREGLVMIQSDVLDKFHW